jgi:hypothetical protein
VLLASPVGKPFAACDADAPYLVHRDDYDRPPLTTERYGYGMFTGTFSGQAVYYHPGDNPGYLSCAGWFPGRAAAIAVLANDEGVSIEVLLRRLLPVAIGVSG